MSEHSIYFTPPPSDVQIILIQNSIKVRCDCDHKSTPVKIPKVKATPTATCLNEMKQHNQIRTPDRYPVQDQYLNLNYLSLSWESLLRMRKMFALPLLFIALGSAFSEAHVLWTSRLLTSIVAGHSCSSHQHRAVPNWFTYSQTTGG